MRRSYLLLFAVLLWQLNATGQTASERRAQKEKESKANVLFQDNDAIFNVREVPAEFEKEPVVLMAQKISFEYGTKEALGYSGSVRKLIKLQDKSAVDEFSSIEFRDVTNEITAFRIIKPNGSIVEVDMTKAVGVDEETQSKSSTVFGTYIRGGFKRKKIAFENLEPGDIIDYVNSSSGYWNIVVLPSCTNPMVINFQEEYPILNFKIDFKVKRGFFINAISNNGAPKLKADVAKSDKRFQYFNVSAKNLKPYNNTDWTFEEVVLPIMKFQICYSNKKVQGDEIVGEMGVVKDYLSPVDIQRSIAVAYNHRYSNTLYRYTAIQYTKAYKVWGTRHLRNVKSEKEAVQKLYNKIRYDFYFGEYKHLLGILDDEFFATLMYSTLTELKYKAKLVAAPGRNTGNLEGLLSRREMYWVVVAGEGSNQQIIYPINKHKNLNDNFWRLSGVEGQIIDLTVKRAPDNFKAKFFRFPEEQPSQNTVTQRLTLNIKENNDLEVKTVQQYTGQNRLNMPYYYLSGIDLTKEELVISGEGKDERSATERRKERKVEDVKAFDNSEEIAKQKKTLENDVSRRFRLVEYHSFKLNSTGRSDKEPVMEVEQHYTIGDMVTKVGNNYLLDLGRLLGKLDKVDTAETRDFPIHYDYPMQVNYNFIVKLPEGYQAEGLNALSENYDTSLGSMVISAKQENGELIVELTRTFKRAEMSKDEWKEFAHFMNLAYNFTQKKVLLKKI